MLKTVPFLGFFYEFETKFRGAFSRVFFMSLKPNLEELFLGFFDDSNSTCL